MMFCKICGGAIDPDVESINGTHAGMDYCVVILNARVNHEQARAEAAEKRAVELETDLEVCRGEFLEERDDNGALRDMIDDLRKEVLGLQAQLDRGWTPPQEPPPENTYVEMVVKGHYHWKYDQWSVLPIDEQLISDDVMGWRNDPEEPWRAK